ncbi:hypothetical protein MKW94_001865 [Papaver nudicaule]|uniref:Manganese-dependent ADP-ribose/CDP-alcohol diphosphatase n=1 Tax=Papaver nudicaule TaxID=74823 RepID=A0AA41V0B7_PAPNU|nr:hypothetical protein [Papaver nudicaule]
MVVYSVPSSFSLGVPRYYRHNILVLQRVVRNWNNQGKFKFEVSLGDIAVEKVVSELEEFNGYVHHMIGNHCLYNHPRKDLLPLLNIPTLDGSAYYDFSPAPEYRFVVLDGYDISAIGWPHDHPKTLQALKVLQEKNPNTDKNNLSRLISCCVLSYALDPGASSKTTVCWNYDKVMEIIHMYDNVKVCLAGHDHKGGHSIDSHGCPPGSDAFGYVDVYDDRLCLLGMDHMHSTEMV